MLNRKKNSTHGRKYREKHKENRGLQVFPDEDIFPVEFADAVRFQSL